ncbi:neuroblast differentiation-associated AHNAK-like isoform X2 [Labeo rohita]|uniref:Periaxin n=1 Tax=Labeo rohita TaxID=84645 RepID=A0A498MNL1_LABRO|nr:neuroblast differentiation-associated AHNAK-like isoform X2 [Labeo rohita]
MCECLRAIFRVTWTPSSDADSDREDSHGNPEARDSPVNNKRRSPPSDRPPFGAHLSTHHSISADEQDSPERIVQKEKLHAELKQVLSQKRSLHRDTQSTLTDMEEPPKTENKNEVEKDNQLSELVEVVVETQAEVGASGYSVVGGGEQGIFIKEVLKDSPAAKHLSLQKGDQLLSARVYFDNVKYEDALKILQCAEPYKVSFFLKRTVPGSEVSIHPGAQNLELRGPKAKMQKMSVKSVKPFKTKKRRGGRFGLKRLKENKNARARAELDIEGSPGRSDLSPVDVEFVFPKFKLRKGGKATGDRSGHLEGVITSAKKKRNIRFPKMKAMDSAVGEGNVNVDVSTQEGEATGAKLKAKMKGPKFGMNFPKIKKSKLDIKSSNDSFDVKELEGKFKPPSVEYDLNMPQGKAGTNVPNLEVSVKGKGEDPEIKMPKTSLDVSDTKVTVPKFKLPKVRLSRHSDEIDGEASKETDTSGNKLKMPKIDIKAPNVDLDLHLPKTKGKAEFKDVEVPDFNVKGIKINTAMPDTSLPVLNLDAKQKFGDDIDGSMDQKHMISLPKLDIAVPNMETSEVDIDIKGPEVDISLPSIDTTLPKGKIDAGVEVEGHSGKADMPKIDLKMSLPEGGGARGDVDIEGHAGKGRKFEMPKFDVSLPKLKPSGGEISVEDIKGHAGKGRKFEMPKFDVSLPKLKPSGGEINVEGPDIKGGKIHMPSVDISLPGGGAGGDVDIEGHAGPDIKGGKFQMPSVDISLPGGGAGEDVDIEGHGGKGRKFEMPKLDVSLPKLKPTGGEINVEGPDIKGGKFQMPSVDISLPGGGAGGDVDIEGHGGKGRKFEMPKLDVSLPKLKPSGGEINVEGPDIKGGKFHMPSVDISLPGGGAGGDVDIEGHGGKGRKFEMPKLDVSLPKLKPSGGEINVEGPDVKGGKIHMPSLDISVPGTTEGGLDLDDDAKKGLRFHMPSVGISLPKLRQTDRELKVGSEKKDIDISVPKLTHDSDIETKATGTKIIDLNVPEVTLGGNIKLPSVKIPTVDISAPKVDLDFTLPKGKGSDRENIELLKAEGGRPSSGASFDVPEVSVKMPKISLPKFGRKLKNGDKLELQSPDLSIDLDMERTSPSVQTSKKDIEITGPEAEIKIKAGAGEITKPEIKAECPDGKVKYKLKFPKFKTPTPKAKLKDVEMDMPGYVENRGKVRMPAVEISLPTANIPECEVLLPKTEVDVSEADIRGYEGSLKIPKMPTIDISVPKVDLDVSLPRVKLHESVDSSDLNTDSSKGTVNFPHVKIPKVDVSLPHGKTGDTDNHDVEIGQKGKLRMPEVEISLPHAKHHTSSTDTEIKGEKLKIPKISVPSVDISLPHGKAKENYDPELEFGVKRSKLKMPDITVPKIDLSLPHRSKEESHSPDSELEGGKLKMPAVDISLPKIKSKDVETSVSVEAEGGQCKMPDIKVPQVDVSLPDADMLDPSTDASLKDSQKEGKKMRMPNVDLELDLSLSREGKKNKKKTDLPDTNLESTTPKEKIKGPKLKGSKFNIGMPKAKVSGLETDINKSGKTDAKFLKGGTDENLKADLQAPKIPELDFDIETAQGDTSEQTGKVKIPKFGIPLPSLTSPDANIKSSQGKGHYINIHSEVEYESPHMPKVTKAVFVMVNPQTENTASVGGEASAEIGNEKLKQPKIKIKPSFGKSRSNEKGKAMYCEDEVETEGKSKTAKLKLPKVTFSSGHRGSFDVTPSGSDDGTSPNLNGDKDEKSVFGKLKLPKLEFFSPYSKDASEEEEMETSMKLMKETSAESKESKESKTISGEMSFSGLKKTTEKSEEVKKITIVSSKARTEMLEEREGSESPVPTVSAGFVSVMKSEEREETTWFKVPKVTLSPHSTGILHITPESSPKGSRSSLPCSSEEASGGFYVKMPSIEFLTHEMPSEHLITKTEGTHTVVTKTTKYTETKSTSSKQ